MASSIKKTEIEIPVEIDGAGELKTLQTSVEGVAKSTEELAAKAERLSDGLQKVKASASGDVYGGYRRGVGAAVEQTDALTSSLERVSGQVRDLDRQSNGLLGNVGKAAMGVMNAWMMYDFATKGVPAMGRGLAGAGQGVGAGWRGMEPAAGLLSGAGGYLGAGARAAWGWLGGGSAAAAPAAPAAGTFMTGALGAGALALGGGAAIVGGMSHIAYSETKQAEEMAAFSRSLGMAVDNLTKLSIVSRGLGDQSQNLLPLLSALESNSGNPSWRAGMSRFVNIGGTIGRTQADTVSPEDALQRVAERYQQTVMPEDRARLAQAVAGQGASAEQIKAVMDLLGTPYLPAFLASIKDAATAVDSTAVRNMAELTHTIDKIKAWVPFASGSVVPPAAQFKLAAWGAETKAWAINTIFGGGPESIEQNAFAPMPMAGGVAAALRGRPKGAPQADLRSVQDFLRDRGLYSLRYGGGDTGIPAGELVAEAGSAATGLRAAQKLVAGDRQTYDLQQRVEALQVRLKTADTVLAEAYKRGVVPATAPMILERAQVQDQLRAAQVGLSRRQGIEEADEQYKLWLASRTGGAAALLPQAQQAKLDEITLAARDQSIYDQYKPLTGEDRSLRHRQWEWSQMGTMEALQARHAFTRASALRAKGGDVRGIREMDEEFGVEQGQIARALRLPFGQAALQSEMAMLQIGMRPGDEQRTLRNMMGVQRMQAEYGYLGGRQTSDDKRQRELALLEIDEKEKQSAEQLRVLGRARETARVQQRIGVTSGYEQQMLALRAGPGEERATLDKQLEKNVAAVHQMAERAENVTEARRQAEETIYKLRLDHDLAVTALEKAQTEEVRDLRLQAEDAIANFALQRRQRWARPGEEMTLAREQTSAERESVERRIRAKTPGYVTAPEQEEARAGVERRGEDREDQAKRQTYQRDLQQRLEFLNAELSLNARIVELRAGPGGEYGAAVRIRDLRLKALEEERKLTGDNTRARHDANMAEMEFYNRIVAAQEQRIANIRNLAGSVFQAILSKDAGVNLGNLIKGFFTAQIGGMFQNAAEMAFTGAGKLDIGNVLPGQGTAERKTWFGKLVSGTIAESRRGEPSTEEIETRVARLKDGYGASPALTQNTAALERLTAAVEGLRQSAVSPTGGGGGSLAGLRSSALATLEGGDLLSKLPMAGDRSLRLAMATLPSMADVAARAAGTGIEDLPLGDVDIDKLISLQPGFDAAGLPLSKQPGIGQALGKGLKYAGLAVGAAYGIREGVKMGGARGALTAVSSGLGAAAMIPSPASPFLAAGALGAAVAASLIKSEAEKRAEAMEEWGKRSEYKPPKAIEQVETMHGQSLDYSWRGGMRVYAPPVSVASPAPAQPPIQVNVQAMDAKSFREHSSDIADSVRYALQHAHPLAAEIATL